MKLFKKMIAMALAVCMLLAMSGMAAFGASPTDTVEVQVTGLETGEGVTNTVRLYKIADATYNEAGDTFTGYEYITGASFANEAEPTSQEIQAIAAMLQAENGPVTPVEMDINGSVASKTVDIGRYIAIVECSDTSKIYNPILLTAGYMLGEDGEVIYGGKVDVASAYAYGEEGAAKSSTVTVEKGAEGWTEDESAGEGEEKQTAGVGDVISYTVTPGLPEYPEGATNKTYFVTDTMSEGLTFLFNTLTVTWDGHDLVMNDQNEFVYNGEVIGTATEGQNGYMIVFDYDKLNKTAPLIHYDAVINDEAVIGTSTGNVNHVELYYSNNPTNGQTWNPDDIPGPETEIPPGVVKEEDVVKVYTYRVCFLKTDDSTEDPKPLAGAVFGLYEDEECTKLVDVITTNDAGYGESVQVAAGTYWLKEISAPSGYTLNTEKYQVQASFESSTTTTTSQTTIFEYTDQESEKMAGTSQVGWLAGYPDAEGNISYTFYKMDEFEQAGTQEDGLVVTAAYVKKATTTTETSETMETGGNGSGVTLLENAIKDSELGQLPSTGGRGVYAFIVIGVAAMCFAAYAIMNDKKKKR